MGIRFSVYVPSTTRPDTFDHVLGDQVKLRPFAEPVLNDVIDLDDEGYGQVTDLTEFARRVNQHMNEFDSQSDNTDPTDDFFYWDHLRTLAKVAQAFRDHGINAHIALT